MISYTQQAKRQLFCLKRPRDAFLFYTIYSDVQMTVGI